MPKSRWILTVLLSVALLVILYWKAHRGGPPAPTLGAQPRTAPARQGFTPAP